MDRHFFEWNVELVKALERKGSEIFLKFFYVRGLVPTATKNTNTSLKNVSPPIFVFY